MREKERARARRSDLLVRDVGDEIVIYDRQRHRVHRLNRSAALVWRACADGATPEALTGLLERELDLPNAGEMCWLALERLQRAQLLSECPAAPGPRVTRRDVLRRMGLAGAATLLLPVVTTILAPTPAEAQTPPACGGSGAPCTVDSDCCPGLTCFIGACFP